MYNVFLRYLCFHITKGMRFYDERNGLYIEVDNFNKSDRTAYCDEYEFDEDGDLKHIGRTLYTFNELTHFMC